MSEHYFNSFNPNTFFGAELPGELFSLNSYEQPNHQTSCCCKEVLGVCSSLQESFHNLVEKINRPTHGIEIPIVKNQSRKVANVEKKGFCGVCKSEFLPPEAASMITISCECKTPQTFKIPDYPEYPTNLCLIVAPRTQFAGKKRPYLKGHSSKPTFGKTAQNNNYLLLTCKQSLFEERKKLFTTCPQ